MNPWRRRYLLDIIILSLHDRSWMCCHVTENSEPSTAPQLEPWAVFHCWRVPTRLLSSWGLFQFLESYKANITYWYQVESLQKPSCHPIDLPGRHPTISCRGAAEGASHHDVLVHIALDPGNRCPSFQSRSFCLLCEWWWILYFKNHAFYRTATIKKKPMTKFVSA